jgi:uncharacterized protein
MKDETTISAIVIRLNIRDGAESLFFSWQAQMAAAAASAPGFLSIEFIPVLGSRGEWQMALQFRDAASLAQWRDSQDRHRLHKEVRCLLEGTGELEEAAAPDLHAQSSVTEVITTHVSSGMTTAYLDWLAKIQLAQAQFPGYRGAYLQSPSQGQAFWTTLIRFATPMQLDAWLSSPARRRLVQEADSLVEAWSSRRLAAPFAGWFPPEEAGGASPNWKQSMVVLLMLFPIVVLELHFLAPLTRGLNVALATFLGNAISVGLLAWPAMPVSNRALDWWLRPAPLRVMRITLLGTALLLGFYLLEILAFSWLFQPPASD